MRTKVRALHVIEFNLHKPIYLGKAISPEVRMKIKLFVLGLSLLTAFLFVTPAEAEIHPGIRAGAYFDLDAFFIGGDILAPVTTRWWFNPNVEFGFGDVDIITVNFDFHYDFDVSPDFYVWAGAGPAILYFNPDGPIESDTDFGVNLFMGFGFRTTGRIIPYIQPKVILSDDSQFALVFGIRF
jgi:hypothetical protein